MVSSQLAMCYLFIIFTDNFVHIYKRPAIGTMARDCIFKYNMDGASCPHVSVCVWQVLNHAKFLELVGMLQQKKKGEPLFREKGFAKHCETKHPGEYMSHGK